MRSLHTRDLLDGTITVHRDLPVPVPAADEPTQVTTQRQVVAAVYTKQRVRAAWDRHRSDLADLACVADVDRRAAEINDRISQLMTMATAP